MNFFNSTKLMLEDGPKILQKIAPSVVLNSRMVVTGPGQCTIRRFVALRRVITRISLRGQVPVGVGRGRGAPDKNFFEKSPLQISEHLTEIGEPSRSHSEMYSMCNSEM